MDWWNDFCITSFNSFFDSYIPLDISQESRYLSMYFPRTLSSIPSKDNSKNFSQDCVRYLFKKLSKEFQQKFLNKYFRNFHSWELYKRFEDSSGVIAARTLSPGVFPKKSLINFSMNSTKSVQKSFARYYFKKFIQKYFSKFLQGFFWRFI